jgi:CheY-like chemotaxis protein
MLSHKGSRYEILHTPESWEAIDLARDQRPDLILMDIRLADICGLEVTCLLNQDNQTTTIPNRNAPINPKVPRCLPYQARMPPRKPLRIDQNRAEEFIN